MRKKQQTRDLILGPPGCEPDWGINWRPHGDPEEPEQRAEVGQIAEDLPPVFRAYLLAEGKIAEETA